MLLNLVQFLRKNISFQTKYFVCSIQKHMYDNKISEISNIKINRHWIGMANFNKLKVGFMDKELFRICNNMFIINHQ